MKPVVDRLEKELGNQIEVIRINIQNTAGRELSQDYDFQYTPTFIFFDAGGKELWREVGSLNVQRVRDSLQ
jgi:thiol-disulfide isomerase/thioredoxin